MKLEQHGHLLRSQALAAIYAALGKEIYYYGDKPLSVISGSIITSEETVEHISHFVVYDNEAQAMITYRYTVQATIGVFREEVGRNLS